MSDDATPAPAAAPTPTGGQPRLMPPPNYAARRMLVTTVAIMAVVAFAVVGRTVIRSEDDSVGGPAGSWSEIALIDPTTGAINVVDGDGELVRTALGRGRVNAVHTIDDRMALVGRSQIVLEDGDETVALPIERSNTVSTIHTVDRLHLVIGTGSGGDVRIVDVGSGEELDLSLIHISEPTRRRDSSRMPSSA